MSNSRRVYTIREGIRPMDITKQGTCKAARCGETRYFKERIIMSSLCDKELVNAVCRAG